MSTPKDLKHTTKKDLLRVLEDTATFLSWKIEVEKKLEKESPIETKMDYVLAAIHMGVSPNIALSLCYVNVKNFHEWLKIDSNKELFNRAVAWAEGLLEVGLYNAAKSNPKYALEVLQRNKQSMEKLEAAKEPSIGRMKDLVEQDQPMKLSDMIAQRKGGIYG